jgi:hypothetical protein
VVALLLKCALVLKDRLGSETVAAVIDINVRRVDVKVLEALLAE